jgi:hypothetical protein
MPGPCRGRRLYPSAPATPSRGWFHHSTAADPPFLLSVDPLRPHTTCDSVSCARADTIVPLLYVLRMWSCPLYRARSLATAVRSRAVCQVACVWSPWSAVRRVAYGTGFYLLLLLLLIGQSRRPSVLGMEYRRSKRIGWYILSFRSRRCAHIRQHVTTLREHAQSEKQKRAPETESRNSIRIDCRFCRPGHSAMLKTDWRQRQLD